ncbi:POU domain transcription factor, class 3 [Sarotherodon galilaeus]
MSSNGTARMLHVGFYFCRVRNFSNIKQKGFIFIFSLVWNFSTFSGNMTVNINQQRDILPVTTQLNFSLGCRAVIPCQHYSHRSDSFKWFYKKDQSSKQVQLFFQDKSGVQYHQMSNPKLKIGSSRSLVISSFTEDDEGVYWCETCQETCQKSTDIIVKKEMWKEVNKTVYIVAGSSFQHTCSSELDKIKWSFEATTALGKSEPRATTDNLTFNKSIYIGNVRREDAGKYTCWMSSCVGHSIKLYTINLCVVTVYDSKDSSASCAVTCGMKSNNPNRTSTTSVHVHSHGSLKCHIDSVFDGYTTVTMSPTFSTNAFSTTTGFQKEPQDWIPLICGISVSCVILVALIIFCSRPRLHSAFPVQICCCGLNSRVEEESSVVYSSIIIRTPGKRINHMASSDCVYCEIKV